MKCRHCDVEFQRSDGVPIPHDRCTRCHEEIEALNEGKKHDAGKPMMELIPPRAELELAKALTFGAEKYGAENWRKVEQLERRYMGAAMRHLNAFRQGETLDAESGLHHLAHAMCCLAFIIENKA